MKRLRLYHRDGCHRCEEMLEQLEQMREAAGFDLDLVDLDGVGEPSHPYRQRIPVLEDERGGVLCEVYFDPTTVMNYLRQA